MTTALATALAGPASALTGFGTGFGFIVAIGPQHAWVLRQGVRREHIGLVIAICALSDLILIATGTGSIGVLAGAAPWALEALRWGGVAYLLAFALSSFRSALAAGGHVGEELQVLLGGHGHSVPHASGGQDSSRISSDRAMSRRRRSILRRREAVPASVRR